MHLALALWVALVGALALAPDALAGEDGGSPTGNGVVDVIEVSGLLDPVLADFVESRLDRAEEGGVAAMVLQFDSSGAVVDDATLDRLVDRVRTSPVPIHVWVGPPGSRATGDAARIVAAAASRCAADPERAPCVGMAVGSRIEVTRELLDVAIERGVELPAGAVAVGDIIAGERAVALGLADTDVSAVGELVVDLPGVETRVVEIDGIQRREPVTQVRFAQLPLVSELFHTVASPPVAYLLFAIGLALLVFELYTAGIGVAGMVGAGSLVLGSYGLVTLPTRPWAVALLLLSAFAYSVDVQTGVPRVWTGIGTVAFAAGSLTLYDGLSMSWVTLTVGIVGMTLAMLGGMPSMVRTRFSTPTIGREWMIGETGSALDRVAPDGTVAVRDARWRARTHRATPIEPGAAVRVVSIDGLVLEVEPAAAAPAGDGPGGLAHGPEQD